LLRYARNDDVEAVDATNQPDGPSRKNIPLNASGKSAALLRASHGRWGAGRDRHERAVGCGGRGVRAGRMRMMRTAKSCGPDAAVLASNRWKPSFCRWRWQKSRSPGRARS